MTENPDEVVADTGPAEAPPLEDAARVSAVVARFGLARIVDRHVRRQRRTKASVTGVCHGCQGEVDLAPFLRDDEALVLAAMESPDERTAIRAWTRLLDENPWLCASCRLLLP